MKVNEYQSKAMRTAGTLEKEDLIINAALGLSGESGEVADIVKKHLFQGHDLDRDKIINELGDVCWYIAAMCQGLGINFSDVLEIYVDKLKKRYPEGFDADKSINRGE